MVATSGRWYLFLMLTSRPTLRSAYLFTLVLCGILAASSGAAAESSFRAEPISEGVWLMRPTSEVALRTNSVVMEREDGLLVIESQPTPQAARELIAAIGKLSSKPIRFLVLSHAHTESTGGASAFPESTLVIASPQTQETLKDESRDLAVELRRYASLPADWEEPTRRLATLLSPSILKLDDPQLPVQIVPASRGHCHGLLLVQWNEGKSYYAGPLVFPDGNPYADTESTNLTGWITTMNSLALSRPEVILPLRGAAFDSDALRQQRDAIAWIRAEVSFAMVERVPVDEIVEAVLASDKLSRYFDPDQLPFIARTLIEVAVHEADKSQKDKSKF